MGALDGHKVFWHQTYINRLPVRILPQNWITTLSRQSGKKKYNITTTTAGLAFKPARMPKPPVRLSAVHEFPGIRVEKYRCDAEHNIVQIDIEYWRV